MFSIHILLPRQTPIYWAKPSIPHSTMKEHPDIVKFCHFSAYVRTRSAGILRGLTPWHTDFGTKSSVLHLVRGVQAPGTHVRSDYSQTRHIGGRPSSHKANLIPQSKRQDTTVMVIPCLCSFTVPSSPFAEPPVNKKRTRTLFRKESGSSTNCMVEHQGVEPWHRSPGLSHFEFFLSHGTWWKIEGISPLCQKIRTIEFTLKISSKSKITRLCADLNPLSKTQKNLPFGEKWERFYACWRERAREIPGAKIHPHNMLLLTLTKSKQQRMDEHENAVRVL